MRPDEALEILQSMKRRTDIVGHEKALEVAIKALEQNKKLRYRCFALTYGSLCGFCPYDCEHKMK